MRIIKRITLLSIRMIVGYTCCFAQEPPRVDIPGSQVLKLTSQMVKGQEYELNILLPGGYKNSGKKYPVLYLMDSQ